jgi:PHD/YefM family antitoxin component YafN of YafNO toxin-antitoxin module
MVSQKIHEQFLVNEKGEKTAVLIPFEEYLELMEDLHDLAVIAERKDEETIPFENLIKDIK